jgi:hypothetical protein
LIRVVLADLFDLAAPVAMDRRMEHAFGVDGQGFWERFFPCNKVHPNDTIIYLFTEHQLYVLYNWWVGKYKTGGVSTSQNMDFSRQLFFNAPIAGETGKEYGYSKTRICQIKHSTGNRFKLSLVFFGSSPDIKKKCYIDFFEGKFEDVEFGLKLTDLPVIRAALKKQFGGPRKNDAKWLCYQGFGIYEKDQEQLSIFEYCGDINACHLLKRK